MQPRDKTAKDSHQFFLIWKHSPPPSDDDGKNWASPNEAAPFSHLAKMVIIELSDTANILN